MLSYQFIRYTQLKLMQQTPEHHTVESQPQWLMKDNWARLHLF